MYSWSEATPTDWNHLRSDDGEVAYVWSTEHRYAGCPDLIGEIGGVRVIADFKTSNALQSTFPIVVTELVSAASESTKSVRSKCHRYALNERTGFLCDVALIIVTTPTT